MIEIRHAHYSWEEMKSNGYGEKTESRIEYREISALGDPIGEWNAIDDVYIDECPCDE